VKQRTKRLKKDNREPIKRLTNGNREYFHTQKARRDEIAFFWKRGKRGHESI